MDNNYLEVIDRFIRRFIILPNESDYTIVTLWITHTYFTDRIKSTPRLALISPEYGCGKSRVLEVLESLCFRGEKLDHYTRSYLMRTVDQVRKETGKPPTLLVDEVDSKWSQKTEEGEAMRAFVNTGYRDKGYYGITEGGDSKKPTKFRTFAPIAMAGKGEVLPESVMSRSIVIRIQKRKGEESIEDFLTDSVAFEAEEIREGIESWSDYQSQAIAEINPLISVRDREKELWLPLFKIAELGGQEWRERVLDALKNHLDSKGGDPISRERQLLTDIRKVWNMGADKMRSAHLVSALISIPDSEWATFNFGKPLNDKAMAKRLRPYGITSKNLRFGSDTYKGYVFPEIAKAFETYLEPVYLEGATPDTNATETPFELGLVASVADRTGISDTGNASRFKDW